MDRIANRLESKSPGEKGDLQGAFEPLQQTVKRLIRNSNTTHALL
jgi:hypothetical protein